MEKRYIITGAAGHVGSTILRLLQDSGHEVYGLLLPGEKPAQDVRNVHYVYGNVREPDTLAPLFRGAEDREKIVIHTAAIISIAQGISPQMYSVNVNGTKNMIRISREQRVSRFVYVSSVHAIPELPHGQTIREVRSFSPDTVVGGYAKTKAIAAQAVLDAAADGFPAVIVHPSGIIGPYDSGRNHLLQMVTSYMDGKLPACVKGGYDFVDVRDVAAGCLLAAEKGQTGACYILSGQYCSIRNLIAGVGQCCGKKPLPALPVPLARLAAPIIEFVAKCRGKRPLYTRYSLHTVTSNSNFSHEKAERELGYCPRATEETIRDMTGWLLNSRESGLYFQDERRAVLC